MHPVHNCVGNRWEIVSGPDASGVWLWSRLVITEIAAGSHLQLTHSPSCSRIWGICVLQQGMSYKGVIYNELLQMRLISLTPSCGLWLVKTGKKSNTGVLCKSLSARDKWHNFLLEADADRAALTKTLPVVCLHHRQGIITHFTSISTLFWQLESWTREGCGGTVVLLLQSWGLRSVCFFLHTSPEFNLNWTGTELTGFHHRYA